ESHAHLRRAVGDDDLASVQRISDSDAAAVVKRNPGRAARGVEKRIEDRPVGDGVGPVLHPLRLAERRRDAPRIEVVATDHDRSGELATRDEIIERDAEPCSIALAEPADARGKSLEVDLLARELDPPSEVRVVREE